jgi:hypothetical protein
MVLLWGLAEDAPLSVVRAELDRVGAPVIFVNQRLEPQYGIEVDGSLNGWLVGPSVSVSLEDISAVYARPYNFTQLDTFEGVHQADPVWRRTARFEEVLSGWCDVVGALVVNRPCQMGSNSSKPYQLEIIRNAGFLTPDTLLSSDPEAVRSFLAEHRQVIYKSISGWRSIVKRVGDEERAAIDDVACCPTQFQQWVEGVDYRVHVIGDQLHATKIVSSEDDYRYSQDAELTPDALPGDVADACTRVCHALDLHFGGVDLRRTPAGRWYCFEVNPSPGFTYFDRHTGAVARALARQLALGGNGVT